MKTTNQQALMALFNASRLSPLKADEHAFLLECAKQLEAFLAVPEEVLPVNDVETNEKDVIIGN